MVVHGLQALPAAPLEALFTKNYNAIVSAYSCAPGPGCVALAFDQAHAIAATEFMSCAGVVEGADTLIVGRHERATLSLSNDASMALRHLMVRYTLDTEGPCLRVYDLKTRQGFLVPDIGLCETVTATGPLHITVGAYEMFFLPVTEPRICWPDTAAAGWAMLPSWQILDRRPPCLEPNAIEMSERMGIAMVGNKTHITILPGVTEPSVVANPEAHPSDAVAVLTVAGPTGTATYAVTASQLKLGLLLGRYDRCGVGGSHPFFDETVSRVHALLLQENTTVMVFDTASTNGLRVDGMPTVAGCLADGAEIELAPGNTIRWHEV